MAPHPTLPIEVFEAIIDQARDNATSLHHLSLTCTSFLPRSRYHLFSSICIRTTQQMESSLQFLDSHPWLLPLVRKVSLLIFVPVDNSTPSIRLLDVVPVHLLSQLPHLRTWRMGLKGFESGRGTVAAWLSFHRSALSCYRKHGGRIQHLELSYIPFESVTDFTGLVSAFTSLRSLSCSDVTFRGADELHRRLSMQAKSLSKPLKIAVLRLDWGVDIRAVEYLLIASGPALSNLTLTVCAGYYGGDDYPERLKTLITQLSQLSSLTLVIMSSSLLAEDHEADSGIWQDVRCITTILEQVGRTRLEDVSVEFKLDPIADLGCQLSWGGAPLEACKALEDALLTLPRSRITFNGPFFRRRAGRAEFWAPTIRRAFPKLDKRGLLTFMSPWDAFDEDTPEEAGHEAPIECLVVSHDSKWVITASRDGTIIIWDAARGTIAREWLAHRGQVYALALSPDSQRLVSSGGGGSETLAVWDIDGSNVIRKAITLEGHTGAVTACAWSPDGAVIASASADGTVRVWDAQTFQPLDQLSDPKAVSRPRDLQFSPDARHLAWISESPPNNYSCGIWSRPFGKVPASLKRLPSHPSREGVRVNALSFDPAGRRVATAHGNWEGKLDEYVVRIWGVETGHALAVLSGHTQRVVDVSFSPDGRSVLSASSDGSPKIWDADGERAEETATLAHGGQEVSRACFSPDGRYVASASWVKTVRLWRTCDAECVVEFREHREDVWHVTFSPDGEFLVSGDWGGVVHIRRLSDSIGH